MKVKIIPIMLLLLISMATPVVMTMAIPKKAEPFLVTATMEPHHDMDLQKRGVQKYSQHGTIVDGEQNTGTIDMDVIITNFYKAYDSGYAQSRVHFTMTFYDEQVITRVITGIIVGKIWFDDEVQDVAGIFVGRGSHVKGTVSLVGQDPNILRFDGMEW